MQKFNLLILICLLSLAVSGCASSENEIISMSLDGAVLIGSPKIDEVGHIIAVTVEPVDVSTILPTFELSSNASIGEIILTDGEACTCTVTAEDGTATEWTITVTVQPGISFTYDGTSKSFTGGVVDSSDSDANEAYGNGVPSLSVCTTGQSGDIGLGFYRDYDLSTDEIGDVETLFLNISNTSEQPLSGFSWAVSSTKAIHGYINVDIDYFGEVEDWAIGTFSGFVYEYVDGEMTGDSIVITNGFFKLLRIADDSGSGYLY